MPIYEYRCGVCRHRFSHLYLSISLAQATRECPECRSEANRIMSRIAKVRTEESRLESLANPQNFSDLNENDPSSVSRWAEKMGREMGEDLGEDFGEALQDSMANDGVETGMDLSGLT